MYAAPFHIFQLVRNRLLGPKYQLQGVNWLSTSSYGVTMGGASIERDEIQ